MRSTTMRVALVFRVLAKALTRRARSGGRLTLWRTGFSSASMAPGYIISHQAAPRQETSRRPSALPCGSVRGPPGDGSPGGKEESRPDVLRRADDRRAGLLAAGHTRRRSAGTADLLAGGFGLGTGAPPKEEETPRRPRGMRRGVVTGLERLYGPFEARPAGEVMEAMSRPRRTDAHGNHQPPPCHQRSVETLPDPLRQAAQATGTAGRLRRGMR